MLDEVNYLNNNNNENYLPDNIRKYFQFFYNVINSSLYYDKLELINYLKNIYFENQHKENEETKFYILYEILKIKKEEIFFDIKDNDFDYFYDKALKIGFKLKKIKESIDLYISFINYNFYNHDYNKSLNLIKWLNENYENYLNQEQILKLKEISILIENNLFHEKDYKDDIFEIFKKERNYEELINFFITYNFKYITNFELEKLQNNLGFLLAFAKSKKYKNFFKDDILGEINNFVGNIYFYNGYYIKAKRHFYIALKKEIPARQKEKILKLDNNLAICFYELGDFDKSLKYFNILQSETNISSNKKLISYLYSNIALIYLRKNMINIATQIIDKILYFKKSINDINACIYSLIKYINFFIYYDIKLAYKYYIELKNIINLSNNKIYNLYFILYQKIFENKNNLREILIKLILDLDYYPLILISFFSLLIKYYPKLKSNSFFQILILKFTLHIEYELKNDFNTFSKSFKEYENILALYNELKSKIRLNNFNPKEIESFVFQIENPPTFFLRKINKNCNIKFPNKEEINKFNFNELIFLLMLKILKRGKIKIKDNTYCFETIFHKKIIKRIDFLQRFYVKEFSFSQV